MYTHVLLDLDHTLLDTTQSIAMAFELAMASCDLEAADRYLVFDRINQALWRQVEAQTMVAADVNVARFTQFNNELGLDADPQVMARAFAQGMSDHGDLYPGARELLDQLRSIASLSLVTNGVREIQRARIARLELGDYFDAVSISDELGHAKPGTAIFELTFDALGEPDRNRSIMVGDSLSSDIAGGNNAGIATCWYNPDAKPTPGADGAQPTYEIARLHDLIDIVAHE